MKIKLMNGDEIDCSFEYDLSMDSDNWCNDSNLPKIIRMQNPEKNKQWVYALTSRELDDECALVYQFKHIELVR